MLTLQQKASIRRHLGIPAAGRVDSNTTMGLRTVTRAGQLEYYMNVLQPEEESILLGKPYGAFILYGPPTAGQTFSVTVGGTTVSYTVQSSDLLTQDPLTTVAAGLYQQMQASLSSYLFQFGTIAAINKSPGLAIALAIQFSVLPANGSATFAVTGVSNVTVVASGTSLPSPAYVVDDGDGNPSAATTAYGLLPICDALEQQLLNSSQNQGFSQVGSQTLGQAVFRPDEMRMRHNLLARYRYEMGVMLAFFPPNSATGMRSFGISV